MSKKIIDYETRKKMLLTPCKTKQDLINWTKYFLGIHLPDNKVSRYADSTPMDMAWEIYSIAVLADNPEGITELLYCAARDSGKTVTLAVVVLLCMVHSQRNIAHIGAIMAQAERCYSYIQGFILKPRIKEILDPETGIKILEKMNMKKSTFMFDTVGRREMEILPMTLKSLNGVHSSLVTVDEIDTASKAEDLKAFKEISGIIGTQYGKQLLRVGISTMKSTFGLMYKQMEEAEKQGRTVRKWTAFEFAEKCSDTRSGTTKTNYWVRQNTLEVISKEEYLRKPIEKKKDYLEYEMYDKCGKCIVASLCLTDAKKQKSKSNMLKPLTDIIKKVRSEGADWSLSQLMNLKPSLEGIIFTEFSEEDHVLSWNKMWLQLTGMDYPGECTWEMFIRKCKELGIPCYSGEDFGWTDPSVCVFAFIDSKENIYVVSTDAMTQTHDTAFIHFFKNKYHDKYRTQLYFPDIASPASVELMKQANLPVGETIKDINLGIQIIKKYLRTPGTGYPKLFIAKETNGFLIEEIKKYHNKKDPAGRVIDIPEDEYNHSIDCLRYLLVGVLGKAKAQIDLGEHEAQMSGIIDPMGNYHKIPNATEFAKANNIYINTDKPKEEMIGKIGKISELENLEDIDIDMGSFKFTF